MASMLQRTNLSVLIYKNKEKQKKIKIDNHTIIVYTVYIQQTERGSAP